MTRWKIHSSWTLAVMLAAASSTGTACSGEHRSGERADDAGSPPSDTGSAPAPGNTADARPSESPRDASADSGLADSAGTRSPVTGKGYYRCRQGKRDVDVPFYLPETIVQAWVPDATRPGGYRALVGAGKDDGSFAIPDVPDGVTYILQIGDYYRYATDQHVIEYRVEQTTRCWPPPETASVATPVTLELAGMTPFATGPLPGQPTDSVTITSSVLRFGQAIPDVSGGATSIATTIDWSLGQALPDATLGDELYVAHRRTSAIAPDVFVNHLVDVFEPENATIRDGEPVTFQGTFHAGAARTLPLSLDRRLFDAGYDPMIVPNSFTVELRTDRGPGLITLVPLNATPAKQLNIPYTDPFPDGWKRSVVMTSQVFRPMRFPGSSTTVFGVTSEQVQPYPGPIRPGPVVQPAPAARVENLDFATGGKLAFDGSPVHVTWSPADGASSYAVIVLRLVPGPEGSTSFAWVAQIRTADTAIDVPGTLFEDGAFYVFHLDTIRAANDYRGGQIEPSGDISHATLPSARFRLSSTCGDSVIQPGEDCDDGGESATCNIDCTRAACGDGLHNATAGEACDSGGDNAIGCLFDCTLSVCGDGRWNSYTEGCDDGNTVDDGNGCTADCMRNNVCGNRRVETVAEQCDDGGDTANCDADCTWAFCGDGRTNRAAGEECDDGFLNNGTGHCSATCKRQ